MVNIKSWATQKSTNLKKVDNTKKLSQAVKNWFEKNVNYIAANGEEVILRHSL